MYLLTSPQTYSKSIDVFLSYYLNQILVLIALGSPICQDKKGIQREINNVHNVIVYIMSFNSLLTNKLY